MKKSTFTVSCRYRGEIQQNKINSNNTNTKHEFKVKYEGYQQRHTSIPCSNPLARSPGQVKLDSDKLLSKLKFFLNLAAGK